MDKAAPHSGILPVDEIEQRIHQGVAHKGASGVGEGCRNTGGSHFLHHGFYGQRGEVGGRTVLSNRLVHRLVACIVRDACVRKVDGNSFRRDGGPPACLPDTDDRIGPVLVYGGFQNGAGKSKPGGNLQFDDLCPGNGVGQQFDSLIGRVDGLSAERVKTGDKDLHEGNLRVLFSAHGKTKHSAAGAADDVHKVGYIVLHEQNIIYLLAQVERTDKDQSERNTAVPAAVAPLQRGRDDKEKQHVAYKMVPACMAQHMTKQPDKKQRIGQRRTIDAEKMIGRPPSGQVVQLLT